MYPVNIQAAPALKVLVVEDDSLIRQVLRAVLEAENFDILEAADGESALRAAHREHPRIVVLDLMLPDLDGLEIAQRLKQDPATANCRIVMVTARSSRGDREAGFAAGADAYLTKPFSPLELLRTVEGLM